MSHARSLPERRMFRLKPEQMGIRHLHTEQERQTKDRKTK